MDGIQQNSSSPPSISSSSSSSSSSPSYDVTVTADGKSEEQQPVIFPSFSHSNSLSSSSPSHPQTFPPLEPETVPEFRKQTTTTTIGAPNHQAIDRFRYGDGHFRSDYLPLQGDEFPQGHYPARSGVPSIQNNHSGNGEYQNRQKRINDLEYSSTSEYLAPDYSKNGIDYPGQGGEQSYVQLGPVDPRSIYGEPRFAYGVRHHHHHPHPHHHHPHHPGYFDPRPVFGGQHEVGFHDRDYGSQHNIDSHEHELRPIQMRPDRTRGHEVSNTSHEISNRGHGGVTGRGHEVTEVADSQISRLKFRQENNEYEPSILPIPVAQNHYFHAGHRPPYHGPIYPPPGLSGFVGRAVDVGLREPRPLDQFDQEFAPPDLRREACPCCHVHGPPSHEHRGPPPYHPVYVDYRTHGGDGYWDPRYFDRSGIPFGYRDIFGYSEHLRNRETGGQHYQMQRNPEATSQENVSRPKNSGLLQERSPQEKSNEEQRRIEQGKQTDKLKARTCESQERVKHDLENTGNKNGLESSQHNDISEAVVENKARFKANGETTKTVNNYPRQESSKEGFPEEEEEEERTKSPHSPPKPSRVSYFLNLNPPAFGRSSLRLNETKKKTPAVTPRQKKSPTVTPPNETRDDRSLTSRPAASADRGFVRGVDTRRSLQLPKDSNTRGRTTQQATAPRTTPTARVETSRSGGDAPTGAAQKPNPAATPVRAKTETTGRAAGKSKATPIRDVFARLWARQGAVGRDDDKAAATAAAAAAERARTVDIYASFRRRPKRTLPAVNDDDDDDQSSPVVHGGSLSRSKSTILSKKTPPTQLKPGKSAGNLQRIGGGEGGGGGGGVGSPSSSEDAERDFDECETEIGLNSENDFANLEEAFKSAMTLFAAERTTNTGWKSETSANPEISTVHHSSKKSNSHTPSTRTKSNPIQGSIKNADIEPVGHHGYDRANGRLSASSVSLATEDPVSSYLNATMRRNPGNKVRRPLSAVYFSEKTKQDDDTCSVLSDTLSTFSLGSSKLMADVFLNLSSSSAESRKEGLSDLQYLLRSAAAFSKKDVKRLTEVFTRMFHEPQTKVFSLFVEVLTEFMEDQDEYLDDWLPVCLERLLTKLGSDLLGSVINKIHRALDAVRNTFRFELQLTALAKFVSEPLHTSNAKVRSATLDHLQFVLTSMNPSDLDSEDESLVVVLDAIVGWAMQTKTSNCKKAAQKLIISAFNLSPPTFSAILIKQSKSVQDFVRKLLHSHLRSASDSIEEEEAGKEEDDESQSESLNPKESTLVRFKRETSSMASNLNTLGRRSLRTTAASLGGSTQTIGRPSPKTQEERTTAGQRPGPASSSTSFSSSSSFVRDNPSRRSGRFKVVAGGGGRGEEQKDGAGVKGRPEEEFRMSKDSGISSASCSDDLSPEGSSSSPVFSPPDEKAKSNEPMESFGRNQQMNATTDNTGKEELRKEVGKCGRPEEMENASDAGDMSRWKDIVLTFSALDSSEEKRKEAMKTLVRDLPRDYTEIPDSSLKTLLCVLCLASSRTDEASELADECISLLLKTRSAKKRIALLRDVASNSDSQIRVSSLQLQYGEFQNLTQQEVRQILAEIVPSLITAFEDNESRVRKASLLCLVQLHKVVRDDIWPHIKNINDNKKNLLTMYFRRTSIASKTLM